MTCGFGTTTAAAAFDVVAVAEVVPEDVVAGLRPVSRTRGVAPSVTEETAVTVEVVDCAWPQPRANEKLSATATTVAGDGMARRARTLITQCYVRSIRRAAAPRDRCLAARVRDELQIHAPCLPASVGRPNSRSG